ncbi:MAG TPA: excinuclease ABC subunit UvrC [Candidatus Dormibacteraeota bacterium]|nr:excinuclease ABC subunit UvrC [Candidatus Dormibacteraeota bacterium]
MDLREKVSEFPVEPGVYLFKDAAEKIIYVGKAKLLRHRVKSYFLDSRQYDAKTGSLVREIAEAEYIVVDNEREALALENNLIKQHKPKFNILLRDDKTYPYICFTATEPFPRVFVTRRLEKNGSLFFGPYFPASLAHRIVHFINRYFGIPSAKMEMNRPHTRAWLEFYLNRGLGPAAAGQTLEERYAEAARDTRMFLEGRRRDLVKSLEERMQRAATEERFEAAAGYRNLIRTVADMEERQKIAAAAGDDIDVLAWHAEPPQVAANVFHLRGGRVVDRREFYWEDLVEFEPAEFVTSLLKQIYLEANYVPRFIHVPMEFEERGLLEEVLSENIGHRVEIVVPQRGPKRAFLDLVETNSKHSFTQRFRVMKPTAEVIAEALEMVLGLLETPKRIESFDISHIQGSDTVASMVVWENGRMKKSDYRKFIIRGTAENRGEAAGTLRDDKGPEGELLRDDFASMREAVGRRYRRLLEEKRPMPSLVLIDGGIGQLHAAAEALEKLNIIGQPLASIAKKEEILYVYGHEDEPIRLDHRSPILHLIQQIRDETHRFAVTFHRLRRTKGRLRTSLTEVPGVGPQTARKLLKRFGSVARLKQLGMEELAEEMPRAKAEKLHEFLHSREIPRK